MCSTEAWVACGPTMRIIYHGNGNLIPSFLCTGSTHCRYHKSITAPFPAKFNTQFGVQHLTIVSKLAETDLLPHVVEQLYIQQYNGYKYELWTQEELDLHTAQSLISELFLSRLLNLPDPMSLPSVKLGY